MTEREPMTTEPKTIPEPEPDRETEILRRLWGLVRERQALEDRWETMTRMHPERGATDEAIEGLEHLGQAVSSGLEENRQLIREGLHALGMLMAEISKGDPDGD